jgi:hypothetical protein
LQHNNRTLVHRNIVQNIHSFFGLRLLNLLREKTD